MDQSAIMVLSDVNQTVQGKKSFTTKNGIKLPGLAPDENLGIGFLNKILKIYDTSSSRNFLDCTLGTGGWCWNLRLVNDEVNKRLKFVGDDGNDLSDSNPAFINMRSTTPGKWFTGMLTSTKYFDYQGASDSDIIGEEFGTTAGVAWSEGRPFAAYVVNKDDSDSGIEIAISPNPNAKLSPTGSAYISYWDNPSTIPSDNNFFFLTGSNVGTSHALKPSTLIGSFRMIKTLNDDWAVNSLDDGDGVMNFYNFGKRILTMPTGQMGAASGKYFFNNGGTAPTYTGTNIYQFTLSLEGFCNIRVYLENTVGGTAGSGAQNLALSLPYKNNYGVRWRGGYGSVFESGEFDSLVMAEMQSTESIAAVVYQSVIQTLVVGVSNNGQSTTSRRFELSAIYQCFAGT